MATGDMEWYGQLRLSDISHVASNAPSLSRLGSYSAVDLEYEDESDEDTPQTSLLLGGEWRIATNPTTNALVALRAHLSLSLTPEELSGPQAAPEAVSAPTAVRYSLRVEARLPVADGAPCVPQPLVRHLLQILSACSTWAPASYTLNAVYEVMDCS